MYQVATPIWNAIAASQPISPLLRPAFEAQGVEALSVAMDNLLREVGLASAEAKVQRAFQTVGPLLAENESISAWMEEANRADLRTAMPELTSTNEALALARAEYRLSPPQERELQVALARFLMKLNAGSPSVPPRA